jgi:hypothetical protein
MTAIRALTVPCGSYRFNILYQIDDNHGVCAVSFGIGSADNGRGALPNQLVKV